MATFEVNQLKKSNVNLYFLVVDSDKPLLDNSESIRRIILVKKSKKNNGEDSWTFVDEEDKNVLDETKCN